MQIILDADKTFYYYGRCTIDQFKSDKRLATIVVVCDVEPYKIEVNGAGMPWMWDTFSFVNGIIHVNTVTLKNNESVTLNLINLKKKVSPTVTTTGKIKFTFNDFSETFTGKKTLVDTVIIGFIANELISIVENAGLMGIPLPSVITKAIDVLTKKGDELNGGSD